jgi:hypothetical protein
VIEINVNFFFNLSKSFRNTSIFNIFHNEISQAIREVLMLKDPTASYSLTGVYISHLEKGALASLTWIHFPLREEISEPTKYVKRHGQKWME